MRSPRKLLGLWRSLFSRSRLDRELDEELRDYLEALIERKVRAGLSEAEARRTALVEMGGVEQVKEEVRSGRAFSGLLATASDLRHAFRMIGRMPGLSAVVILSLGVGIGVNTAVFSWIQAVVLRPLPGVANAASFLLVEPRSETGSYPGVSWLEYRDLKEALGAFEEPLVFRMASLSLGEASRSERVYGLLVSDNYFSSLGLRPALGRFPAASEVAGEEPGVVISNTLWQARFGGAASALGQTLHVNDRDLIVVGVTPPGFQGTVLGLEFNLWIPATLAPSLLAGSRELEDRNSRGYSMMGRLRPGTSAAQAQVEVDAAMRHLAVLYPETNAGVQGEVMPFWRAPRGPQRLMARGLWILQGVLLLLLLAVCGNTANLLLARASAREREIGVRLALGAGPWRIVRLLLAESLLLALLGASLGVAIAFWASEALRAVPTIASFPVKFQTPVDALGLGFAILIALLCGLVFGAAPAFQLARLDPQVAIRSGPRPGGRGRMQGALMGAEVAIALVVLVVAALFFRSFHDTRDTDPGFKREGVLLAAYDLTGRGVDDDASARSFAARLLKRVRALPGVEEVAIARGVPLDIHGLPARAFTLEGRGQTNAAPDRALVNTVTPGYLRVMGIPLVTGADFADLDDPTKEPQAIVNEEFVRRYLEGRPAIGRRLESRGGRYTIVGVARNSLYESFGEPSQPVIYFSYRDRPGWIGEIHVRTRAGSEATLADGLRRAVRDIDSTLPVYDVRTLGEHVEKNLFFRRIPARLFAVLGPLLLMLAAIGIYAVVAYTVAQRTTEIGVRLALGGTARRIQALIVGDSLRVIAVGALTGWMIAFVVYIHVARSGSIDVPVLVGVPLVLLLAATVAAWIPARRATRDDPMLALRHD
jgi:predicted permease